MPSHSVSQNLFHKSRVVLCQDVWPSKSGGYSYLEYHLREFQHVNRPPDPPKSGMWNHLEYRTLGGHSRLMEQVLRNHSSFFKVYCR